MTRGLGGGAGGRNTPASAVTEAPTATMRGVRNKRQERRADAQLTSACGLFQPVLSSGLIPGGANMVPARDENSNDGMKR